MTRNLGSRTSFTSTWGTCLVHANKDDSKQEIFFNFCAKKKKKWFMLHSRCHKGFPRVALVVKTLPANAGDAEDLGSIPGSGRSPGEGNGNPFQY